MPAIRASAMPDAPITCQRAAALRLAERRPEVPLLSVPDPSGSRSQMPPKGFMRAAIPHSWLDGEHAGARRRTAGITDAPGPGLRRRRQQNEKSRQKARSEYFSGLFHSLSPATRPHT